MRQSFTKTLAAVTVAAAALSLPMAASAGDYRKCKDTEAAIAGGLIGGSLGTVIGEEIAGRGDKTEGAIAGALIGGVIGAAIGDGVSDCEKDGKIYRNGRVISSVHYPSTTRQSANYRTVHHNRNNRGYNDRYRYNDRGYQNRHYNNRHYNDRHYSARQHDRDLRRIDRQMDALRYERNELKQRARYEGHRRWIDRRLREIGWQLDRLKDERRRVKKAYDNRRQPYQHHRRW